jgi:vacuolar protein sorting-associated protein 54
MCRMMRDAEYFKTRIGGLDGAGDAGDYLINVVKEKSVPVAITAPEPTNGQVSSESGSETKVEETDEGQDESKEDEKA